MAVAPNPGPVPGTGSEGADSAPGPASESTPPGSPSPVRFVFGLHLHQPWGNFDHVFREHVDQVYRPTLRFLEEREIAPYGLHVSGPLLEWLETHDRPLHDRIGRLASEGQLELLSAGFYEPILAALDPVDRAQQLNWMSEYLQDRFGVGARSAWLTERVFESELVGDLAAAGVENLLVDDWHLLAAGVPRDRLHRTFRTEGAGREINLLPIHEELRYLVPFQPADAVGAYFRDLQDRGVPLAILADDGEKFGGWPGTFRRVWEQGWFQAFADVLVTLREAAVIRFVTPQGLVDELGPQSLAYPPSSSYREMGEWAQLPKLVGSDHPFEGAPWRNFFLRYPESNAMHKKARALSRLCRARGNPEAPRRAIGRAQCNDPYWHGVFGGIYMKHLRDATWRQLAEAESRLREDEGLQVEQADWDLDGEDELWIHSRAFSALVGLATGRVKELTRFAQGANLADVLTRRWEAYHGPAVERGRERAESAGGDGEHSPGAGEDAPSIHDLEDAYVLDEAPVVDWADRTLLAARVIPGGVDEGQWARREASVLCSFEEASESSAVADVRVEGSGVTLTRERAGIRAELWISDRGDVEVRYEWDPNRFPTDALFTVEVSLSTPAPVVTEPQGTVWRYPVITVPRSERGFERIAQGESTTVLWPIAQGAGVVRLVCPRGSEATGGP